VSGDKIRNYATGESWEGAESRMIHEPGDLPDV